MKIAILATLLFAATAVAEMKVTRISEKTMYGSAGGGTFIIISGEGFVDNSFGEAGTSDDLGIEVFFCDDTTDYECDVNKDATDENTLTCESAPMPVGDYKLKIKSNGEELPSSQYCGGNHESWNCHLHIRHGRTPTISSFQPSAATPRSEVQFWGRIFTDKADSANSISSNGNTASIFRAYVGEQCKLRKADGSLYGIELTYSEELERYSNYGFIKCLHDSNYVGNQNASFIIEEDYGRSVAKPEIMIVRGDYGLSAIQTYAEIESVSPAIGSTNGGTTIEVTGNYLNDPDNIKVLVGGEPCVIEDIEETHFTCKTPSMSTSSLYPGSRGVMVEVYTGIDDVTLIQDTLYDDYTNAKYRFSLESTQIRHTASESTFIARLSGFIIPPRSGTYTISTNRDADVYLSPDSTRENKNVVPAEGLELKEGEHYYYEIVRRQSSTDLNMDIKAYSEQSDYLNSQTSRSVDEVKEILSNSPKDPEIQKITLTDWTPNETPVNEVLELCVKCTDGECTGIEEYVFSLHGISSGDMLPGSSAETLQDAINQLQTILGDTVTVTKSTEASDIGDCFSHYTITVGSARGHLQLQAEPKIPSQLSTDLTIVTDAAPDKNSFTVSLGGIPTGHVSIGNIAQLSTAVQAIFGAECPNKLKSGLGDANLFLDFETESPTDELDITAEESYCGSRSVRNPTTLFEAGGSVKSISVGTDTELCLAYKGPISVNARLVYTYIASDEKHERTLNNIVIDASADDWTHTCVAILPLMKAQLNGQAAFQYKIQKFEIVLNAADEVKGDDFYMDIVFIGKVTESSNLERLRGQRRLPLHENRVWEVTVEESASNEYLVTLVPENCAHDFPMIEIGYASSSTSGTYTNDGDWGTSMIKVEQIQAASPPIAGTFSLTLTGTDPSYGGTLTDLAWDVEADYLEKELQTLNGIEDVTVTRGGSCRGYNWEVTFKKPAGKQGELSVDFSGISNDQATFSVTTKTVGGLYLNPIPGDWVRTSNSKPQVQVFINGVPSRCTQNCDFEWSTDATPVVDSASSTGSQVNIAGTGFSDVPSKNSVTIGGVPCSVTASTESSVTCTMGESPAGSQKLVVTVDGKGNSNSIDFEVEMTITSISPETGSDQGGTEVTVIGTGFSADITVQIGASSCDIQEEVQYTSFTCITSPNAAGEAQVTVVANPLSADSPTSFQFQESSSEVTSISPARFNVEGGALTLSGSGFGDDSTDSGVYIGDSKAELVSWTDTEVSVTAPKLLQGSYTLRMFKHPEGNIKFTGTSAVEYVFEVSNITPLSSSLMGGRELVITGDGFDAGVEVKVGETLCEIDEAQTTSTSITCAMGTCGKTHRVDNTGTGDHGVGYAWSPNQVTLAAGDTVEWVWSPQPLASSATYQVFTIDDAASTEYNNNGFNSGSASATGKYQFQFNVPGTYYVGGWANSAQTVFMSTKVIVGEAVDVTAEVTVTAGDFEATFKTSATSISCEAALTPTITSISPGSGTSETLLTISGTGFSDGETAVLVGEAQCVVEETTPTSVSCKVPTEAELPIGLYQEVKVNVAGKGLSRTNIQLLNSRYFALKPHITSVSPTTGSLAGGTTLTAEGGGLSAASSITVGTSDCAIVESTKTYTSVKCVTGSSSAWSGPVDVRVFENGATMTAECTSSCDFEYSSLATPTLTAVSPDTISETTALSIDGSGFGTDSSAVTVAVGGTNCVVTAVTESNIECDIGDLPAGTHTVDVSINGKGKAALAAGTEALTVSSQPVISSVSPTTGSINGGTEVTFAGNGFLEGQTSVVVESTGDECTVKSVSPSAVTFLTPPGSGEVQLKATSNGQEYDSQTFTYSDDVTPSVASVSPAGAQTGETISLTGTKLTSVEILVGDVPCEVTSSSDASAQCVLGSRHGGSATISARDPALGFATIDPAVVFEYTFGVNSVSPSSGSLGGGQTLTVNGAGFSAMSTVSLCDISCEIVGDITPSQLNCITSAVEEAKICSVKVFNEDSESVELESAYTYDASISPSVTSIEPTSGGTGGGTVLTISGSMLSKASKVTIDGTECDIDTSSISDDSIQCTTNSHVGTIKTKVEVIVGTDGLAINNDVEFEYIDKWSSKFTWGGESVPQAGEFIVIKKGQTVLFDVETPVLKMLLIQGGSLIFADSEDIQVHLHAEHILITDDGLLQIGTEDHPYQATAAITMHGNLHSKELPIYGAKTLGVREGTLDIHGNAGTGRTWTFLASTAAAGATQISVLEAVPWKVGHTIVIATTGSSTSQGENEEAVIAAISDDGKTLTLEEALQYEHMAVTETYDTPTGQKSVDYRAEVAWLTRNIKFQGSQDNTWDSTIEKCPDGFNPARFGTQTCFQGRHGEEQGSDAFGAQLMFHSPKPIEDDYVPVTVRVEGLEVSYAGQANRIGRYAIHSHLMGDMSRSYLKRCSIHHSFNRATTIHGTNNWLVEYNVAYYIRGGTYFIEDGIETGNIIQHNIAIFTIASSSLLNDDVTPASFWITNPYNFIRYNHAAGGSHFGFWYRMHEHPDGPSFTTAICQRKALLGEFAHNTAHGFGQIGLWIFQEYTPMEGGSCNSWDPWAAKYEHFTAWNCGKGAEWVDGGAIQFNNFVLSNNIVSVDVKRIFDNTQIPYDDDRGAMVKDGLFIGHPDHASNLAELETAFLLPMSGGLAVSGNHFYNFGNTPVFAITTISGTCTHLCGGWQHHFSGMSFTNSNKRLLWKWRHEAAYHDLDGSFTGSNEPSVVVPWAPIYVGAPGKGECVKTTDNELGSSDTFPSAICDPSVKFHRWAFNNPTPESLSYYDVNCTNQWGSVKSSFEKKRISHTAGWMFLLRSAETYTCEWDHSETIANLSYTSKFYDLLPGDWLIMKHQMHQLPDKVEFSDGQATDGQASALTASNNHLDWYYDQDEGMISYKVANDNEPTTEGNDRKDIAVSPNIYRCFYKDCKVPLNGETLTPIRELPADRTIVTDLTTKSDCFDFDGETAENNDVRIPDGCTVEWAIPDAVINNLQIRGIVVFSSDIPSIKLAALSIVVWGHLYAGWDSDSPFRNSLHIVLRGNTASVATTDENSNIEPKILACYGLCEIHGENPELSRTRLTGVNGAEVTFQDPVSWVPGSVVAFGPTGFNANQAEQGIVKSVSSDGKTVTLEESLTYPHISHTESFGEKWADIDMSAEVMLMSRNVLIEGEEYDELLNEGLGGRVFVATKSEITAKASFSNVEFYHCGQLGLSGSHDNRVQLGFLEAALESEVRKCTFRDGFSPAIGLYGTSGSTVADNSVFHSVGGGIVVEGDMNTVINNWVIQDLLPFTYRDRFVESWDYPAAIDVEKASDVILTNNRVAGAERAGYRIAGQPCEPVVEKWEGNVAHAALVGIFQMESVGDCTLVNGFTIYKSWDYGIYHQTSSSIRIENTAVVDCTVGYAPLIYGPSATDHEFADKWIEVSNSLFSGPTTITNDMDENTDDSLKMRRIAGVDKKAQRLPSGGQTGMLLPYFSSAKNGATFKNLIVNMDYPAIKGRMTLAGNTFTNYGEDDAIFRTNPDNEDYQHPVYLTGSTLMDVSNNALAYIDVPSLGKLNPSDCVDMPCEGMREILIKDTDGSYLGSSGSIISESATEWNGDSRYGMGDNRIPFTMLADENGNKIELRKRRDTTSFPTERGIPRNSACSFNEKMNAYTCVGDDAMNYRVLVIESLDADTEVRRLSPIALRCDNYVDLINGPQDHGWCGGYTCQKRLSTFWAVIPDNCEEIIHMTGTPPKNIRFQLLNNDGGPTAVLGIYMPIPQKLDVFNGDDVLVAPNNEETKADGRKVLKRASDPTEYKPTGLSTIGANYLDMDRKILYVAVGGTNPITVRTTETVYLTFGFPPITIDEFFWNDLLNNLAAFLSVDKANIREVSAVRETSRRRRSTDGDVSVTVEITEKPTESKEKATDSFQDGTMSAELGLTVNTLEASQILDNETIANTDEALRSRESVDFMKSVAVPTKISFVTFPTGEELSVLSTTTIHLLDDTDTLTETSDSWTVSVTLDSADPNVLSGTKTVAFTNGKAEFKDLAISLSGTYKFIFTPSGSASALPAIETEVVITDRIVNVNFIKLTPTLPKDGDDLLFELQLVDKNSDALTDVSYKGLTWKVEVTFDDSTLYSATSPSTNVFTFDGTTGLLTTTGLSISGTRNYGIYNLNFRLYTEPASSSYDKDLFIKDVQIYPTNEKDYLHNGPVTKQLKLIFINEYDTVTSTMNVLTIQSVGTNFLSSEYPNLYFSPSSVSKGAGSRRKRSAETTGPIEMSFNVIASDEQSIDGFVNDLQSKGFVRVGSTELTLASSCAVTTNGVCYGEETATQANSSSSTTTTTAAPVSGDIQTNIIIFATLGGCAVLSAIIIIMTCFIKRQNAMRKVSVMRCMDSRAGTPESQAPLSYSLDSLQTRKTMDWGNMTPDSTRAYDNMTPVA